VFWKIQDRARENRTFQRTASIHLDMYLPRVNFHEEQKQLVKQELYSKDNNNIPVFFSARRQDYNQKQIDPTHS
jgi:hypothetical protein